LSAHTVDTGSIRARRGRIPKAIAVSTDGQSSVSSCNAIIGFSDPLENEEPFKVVRPPDYTEEMEEKQKGDEAPSVSFSTTETLSSWMREANMDADIVSYSKSVVLRRDEYFFRIWYYASKLFK